MRESILYQKTAAVIICCIFLFSSLSAFAIKPCSGLDIKSRIQAKLEKWVSFPFPLINVLGGISAEIIPTFHFAEGFKANVSNVTLGYNEQVKVKVGNYDIETGIMVTPQSWWFNTQRTVTYAAEFPNGNPGGAWFVTFEPPVSIQTSTGGALNATATIYLRPSRISTEPIQNCLIRIKFSDAWSINDLWRVEIKNWNKVPVAGITKVFFIATWPIVAFTAKFGKNSGQTLVDDYYFDIVAKVKTFHQVTFQEVGLQQLEPNQITSIPVSVINRGNYNDSIGFQVVTPEGTHLETNGNTTITLAPGAQGQAFIAVAVPPNFLDTGTLHSIKIQAYSTEQPNVIIGEQTIPLETQGLYVSELTGAGFFGIGILIVLIIVLVFLLRRRFSRKRYQEPEKPWKLAEEQEHLAELKRTDPEAYDRERMMMAEEYESAMLWFKDYKKAIRHERPWKKTKTTKTTTTPMQRFRKISTLIRRKRPAGEKKVRPSKIKPARKPQPPTTTPVKGTEDRERDKALQRILKEQQRQARFLRKS